MAFERNGNIKFSVWNNELDNFELDQEQIETLTDDIIARAGTCIVHKGYVCGDFYRELTINNKEYEFKGYWELVYD